MTAITSFFFMLGKISIKSTVIGMSSYWKLMLRIVDSLSLCLWKGQSTMKTDDANARRW